MREARERILKMERDFKEAENLMEYDPDEVPFWEQMKALDKMATVRFHQKCISVSLRDEDETKRILTTLRVQDLFADVCARVSYIELSMRVQNLDISDNYVKDTKYPHIVSYVSLKIVCVCVFHYIAHANSRLQDHRFNNSLLRSRSCVF